MALQYSPKIVQDGLVMCLDASQNKSYPTTDLPVKNGLVMWMDAADDTTFSYSSGTTVSQWRDKSGFNYHMTPTSAGPTRNSILNSRKVLAFTSTQDIRNLSIDLRGSAYTAFCITRYSGGVPYRALTSTTSTNWLLGHWSGFVNQYYALGWVQYQGYSTDSVWRVYMGDWSGASTDSANMYSNGTALVTNSNQASDGPFTLGINAYTGERSECEAAEIIVFNRVLTTPERRLVHTYLGQKWGISNTDRSVVDLTSNNYSGLLGNNTASSIPSFDYYNKGAFKLDGSNDYITTGISGIIPNSTSSYTVSTWVNRNRNNVGFEELLSQWTYANSGNSFFFGFNNSNVRFTDNWNDVVVSGAGNTNVWMNLVGVYSVSNAYIYLNGALIATKGSGFYYTGTGSLVIGRQGELDSEYFNGNLSNVLIYNKALSAAEVLQNYEAQKSKFANSIVQQGLVLNLDAGNPYSYAGAGTTWYDVSGNNYSGSLISGSSFSTDGGGCIVFDGVDDYVSIPSNNNFNNGNNITVEAWVLCTNWSSYTHPMIVAKGINVEWILWKSNDVGYVGKLGWRGVGTAYTTTSLPNNTWVQCVGSIGSAGQKVYLNGVLESTVGNTTFTSGNVNVTIAAGLVTGSPANLLGANVAITRIYNTQLTDAQVLQNYNATKGRFGL